MAVSFFSMVIVDEALASDGFAAYRSNSGTGLDTPKVRYWNNTANAGNGSWSSEIELPSAGSPVRHLAFKQSPISSKMILVTSGDDGFLDGYVCMKYCSNASNWNYTSNIGNISVAPAARYQRGFDIVFETDSGDALLVYGVVDANTARDLAFKTLPEDTISFEGLTVQYLDDTGHGTNGQYLWIALDSNPVNTSNELILAGFDDTNNDVNAWVWNGAAFSTINSITDAATGTLNREAHAVKYSSDGSVGMVGAGTGTAGNIVFEYWASPAWTAITARDIDTADGNDIEWLSMKADPSSDDLQLVILDSGNDLHTWYWDGATWDNRSTNIDVGVDVRNRTADFSWLNDGTGRLVWDTDAGGTTLSTRICSPMCNSTTQTISTYAGTGAWMALFRNPTASDIVKFLGIRLNSAFDIGVFRYNGTALNYTNYGDNVLTLDTTLSQYEAFTFDYRRDLRPPNITFIYPNASGILTGMNIIFVNATSSEYLESATLEWNGTNYTMNGPDMIWNYTLAGLVEGFYPYRIYAVDWAGNLNVTEMRNITVNFPPSIMPVNPPNNTLNDYSRNTTFYFNVTDNLDDVSSCSLIVEGAFVLNTTVSPVSETSTQNFTYAAGNGQHNWSIWCNDTSGLSAVSETRNLTGQLDMMIYSVYLDDGIVPEGEILLSAGMTRNVNCSITVGDPDGPDFINNVTGKFYYLLNRSNDPDNNNVHYTNSNCTVTEVTAENKTFVCGFDVYYYANNGTWICNLTVSSYPLVNASNTSGVILPLYAVNLTDGIQFSDVAAGFSSANITANITNFGNMAVNITLQGYAAFIGDGVGMNCSDGSNITITNIRFSINNTADFPTKVQLNGSVQPLRLQVQKQTGASLVFNTTYWQIRPDPGVAGRICNGYIIFNAEAP